MLTIYEQQRAENAVAALLPPYWVDAKFLRNWNGRLDFVNSTLLEACAMDRELYQVLSKNSIGNSKQNIKAAKKAYKYNCEVIHNADDERYFDRPALPIYLTTGNTITYQWDEIRNKPAGIALVPIGNGQYAYDWDPANPRT